MVVCGRDSQVCTFHRPCTHRNLGINCPLRTNLKDTILLLILHQDMVLLGGGDDVVASWQRVRELHLELLLMLLPSVWEEWAAHLAS